MRPCPRTLHLLGAKRRHGLLSNKQQNPRCRRRLPLLLIVAYLRPWITPDASDDRRHEHDAEPEESSGRRAAVAVSPPPPSFSFPARVEAFAPAPAGCATSPRRRRLPMVVTPGAFATSPPTAHLAAAAAAGSGADDCPPSWTELGRMLPSTKIAPPGTTVDSALDPSPPTYSTNRPTLFRERHGWCPYSERVWLALEYKGVSYDTIRIDNTGPGVKPPYFSGQTPQIRWADGTVQGESMDLVRALDEYFPETPSLYDPSPGGVVSTDDVEEAISKFRHVFPRNARPSSRAAFLFSWGGEPLPRSEFERVLRDVDELLSSSTGTGTDDGGAFFCGGTFSAADVAWAPFLERYRAQLPCLHDDLRPRDPDRYPALSAWYDAMENTVGPYRCRVMGDDSSWRKVLTMAGFGNAGDVPPSIMGRMEAAGALEDDGVGTEEDVERLRELWDGYASTRPHVAPTPAAEAAAVIVRNRAALAADAGRRAGGPWNEDVVPPGVDLDAAMRGLACRLLLVDSEGGRCRSVPGVADLARFLDGRMCVPRDMSQPSAAAIKRIARRP